MSFIKLTIWLKPVFVLLRFKCCYFCFMDMEETTIKEEYIKRLDAGIKLLCSHASKKENFLDILLSKALLSSEETWRLLGTANTHRQAMSCDGRAFGSGLNYEISFSTGFVSFKYSDCSILTREQYVGGVGVFVSLDAILKNTHLSFSHCSYKGGIKYFDLNKDNIRDAVHLTRKSGELCDDGYGNVFEIGLWSEFEEDSTDFFKRVINYPRLDLTGDVIVAIPETEQDEILNGVKERQEMYEKFLEKISDKSHEELVWQVIDGRNLTYADEMIPFMQKLLESFNIDELPVVWYEERNLDIALQYRSLLL